jgi:hypothetical protein
MKLEGKIGQNERYKMKGKAIGRERERERDSLSSCV